MTNPRLSVLTLCLAGTTLAAAGCGPLNLDEAAASEGADSTEVAQSEGALMASGVDDQVPALTAAGVAAARGALTHLQPDGCATVTQGEGGDGNTVTTVLDDCSGRFGLVHITGTVVSVYSDADDGVHIATTAQGLAVNRAVIDIDATGVLSDDGGKRKLVVTTHGAGTGPRGHAFTRDGSYTIERDPSTSCVDFDGSWKVIVSNLQRTTTVTGLQRCDGMCPAAGGQIVHTGFRARTVTVTFDGSASAAWSSSSGRTGTIDLACGT